jgi:cation-transporting ATPase F
MALLQVLFVYAPFMNAAFQSAPIAPADWLSISGVGVVILLIIEIEKSLWRRFAPKLAPPAQKSKIP